MPTVFQHPGVYMTEVPPSSRPIEGVATSVAAFVGRTPMGPANMPTRVTSWTEFARTFGDPNPKVGPFLDDSYMAHAVRGYFLNGGTTCWIVRVEEANFGHVRKALLASSVDKADPAFAFVPLPGLPDSMTVKITVADDPAPTPATDPPAPPTVTVTVTAENPDDPEFSAKQESKPEVFRGLSARRDDGKYLVKVINAAGVGSRLVSAEEVDPASKLTRALPKAGDYPLAAPPDDEKPTPMDISGDSSVRSGMTGLEIASEVTMVCLPDLFPLAGVGDDGALTNPDAVRSVQGNLVAACAGSGRMAILDPPPGLKPTDVQTWRDDPAMPNDPYATLYWPWIEVLHPITGEKFTMPPCGHVAGVWARTDTNRGVHKAPANEELMGTVGLGYLAADGDSDLLNPDGINVIRGFTGRGTRIWGGQDAGGQHRAGMEVRQRPAAVQLRRDVDPQRHELGGLRAQRRAVVGPAACLGQQFPDRRLAQRCAVRHDARRRVLRQVRRGHQPPGPDRWRPGEHPHRDRPRQAGGVRRLPDQPVRRDRHVAARPSESEESPHG